MVTEKAPLIAPEQGLLRHLYLFGAGIVLFHALPAAWQGGDRLLGVVLWMYAEDPMGVLLGMSRNKPLVLIKNENQAMAYGHLSDFARDLASRRLGRRIIDYVPADCAGYCRHQFP